jgi:hypothetical protein
MTLLATTLVMCFAVKFVTKYVKVTVKIKIS